MDPCACGHDRADHARGECEHVLRPDVFCPCTGFRVEQAEVDPRFRGAHLQAVDRDRAPAWTADAECRRHSLPGQPWAAAFVDDPPHKADPDDYAWSTDTLTVMETCAGCPVRRPCLAFAYESVLPKVFGDTNMMSRHTRQCDDDYLAWKPEARRCTGCLEFTDEVKRRPFRLEEQHEGVLGGVPGPVRQHFALDPLKADRWFRAFSRRAGWAVTDTDDDREAMA